MSSLSPTPKQLAKNSFGSVSFFFNKTKFYCLHRIKNKKKIKKKHTALYHDNNDHDDRDNDENAAELVIVLILCLIDDILLQVKSSSRLLTDWSRIEYALIGKAEWK